MRIKVLRSNPPVLRCWIRRYWFKRVIGGCMEGWWQWLACTSGLPIAQRTKCNRLSSSQILEMMLNRVKKHARCDLLQFAQELAQTICQARLGKPLFEMCWFYMGIAQIALEPPLPPSVKRANVEKKCPKPSWQAFTPPHPLRAMPIWKQLIYKKGLP